MVFFLCLIVWTLVAGLLLRRMTLRLAQRAQTLVPQTGHITAFDDGAVHWQEWGMEHKGVRPTLVLVHGVGSQLQNFRAPLVERLAQSHHVVALDRPGCGYSVRPETQDASFATQAKKIADFIEHQGLGACVMVGHSLAGGIALRQAIDRPETVASLALLAPVSQPMGLPPAVFRSMLIPTRWLRQLIAAFGGVPLSKLLHPTSLKVIFGPEPVLPNYMDAPGGGGWLGLRPSALRCFSQDLVASPESLRDLDRDYPSLAQTSPVGGILYGTSDQVLSAKYHGKKLAQRLPSLDYQTLPDSGHMFFLSQFDVTAAFILAQADKADKADKAHRTDEAVNT